jgi:hypothetical protein
MIIVEFSNGKFGIRKRNWYGQLSLLDIADYRGSNRMNWRKILNRGHRISDCYSSQERVQEAFNDLTLNPSRAVGKPFAYHN